MSYLSHAVIEWAKKQNSPPAALLQASPEDGEWHGMWMTD
jgi:hypothetical protein